MTMKRLGNDDEFGDQLDLGLIDERYMRYGK
jgi:hypothetical protein